MGRVPASAAVSIADAGSTPALTCWGDQHDPQANDLVEFAADLAGRVARPLPRKLPAGEAQQDRERERRHEVVDPRSSNGDPDCDTDEQADEPLYGVVLRERAGETQVGDFALPDDGKHLGGYPRSRAGPSPQARPHRRGDEQRESTEEQQASGCSCAHSGSFPRRRRAGGTSTEGWARTTEWYTKNTVEPSRTIAISVNTSCPVGVR